MHILVVYTMPRASGNCTLRPSCSYCSYSPWQKNADCVTSSARPTHDSATQGRGLKTSFCEGVVRVGAPDLQPNLQLLRTPAAQQLSLQFLSQTEQQFTLKSCEL